MTGESLAAVALGRLVGRNRRRYGGYIVHAGIAVLFLGVAASSAFIEQRDVRLSPGQSFGDGRLPGHLRAADRAAGRRQRRHRRADLVRRGAAGAQGRRARMLRPPRNYYPTHDAPRGRSARYFEGEATSEVDVRWGLRRDLWTAVRPDISALDGPIREANRRFADSGGDVQALVIAAIVERYRQDPPPATFRTIVSPLVSWIWIGGGIVLLGALIAAWPSPEARLRRVRRLYSARLGKELAEPQRS